MPFMIGRSPIRRTVKYLKNCRIFFRENVRIFSISFALNKKHSQGASDFVLWHLPQIQYNNPTVQCVKLPNLTPTPFIKIYRDDDEPVVIDLDSRTKDEILNHLNKLYTVTKTFKELIAERATKIGKCSPSYFGSGCMRHCLCEIPGQVLCPNVCPLPNHWRGKPPKKPTVFIPPYIEKWGKETLNKTKAENNSPENMH